MGSSRCALCLRHIEGFPKAKCHSNEGTAEGQAHTEQSCGGYGELVSGGQVDMVESIGNCKLAFFFLFGLTRSPDVRLMCHSLSSHQMIWERSADHSLSQRKRGWQGSSAPAQAAVLTQRVSRVIRLPFPQSLQCFSKRINGWAALWEAKSMEEHWAPRPRPLVTTREENGDLGLRDREYSQNHHPWVIQDDC